MSSLKKNCFKLWNETRANYTQDKKTEAKDSSTIARTKLIVTQMSNETRWGTIEKAGERKTFGEQS